MKYILYFCLALWLFGFSLGIYVGYIAYDCARTPSNMAPKSAGETRHASIGTNFIHKGNSPYKRWGFI